LSTESIEDAAVVLLAAGTSTRFGSDKRLHLIEGKPMILRTADQYKKVFSNLFIVIKESDEEISQILQPLHPSMVVAENAHEGMGASLAAGVESAADYPNLFIALADMPYVETNTLQRLYEILVPNGIVRPVYQGTPGHPVGFTREYYPELTMLQGDTGAREVIRNNLRSLVQLWVNDSGVLRDVDRPE